MHTSSLSRQMWGMSKAVEEDLSFMLSSVKYDEDVTMNSEKLSGGVSVGFCEYVVKSEKFALGHVYREMMWQVNSEDVTNE